MTSVRYSQILINTEINRLSRKASKKPQKYWDHYTSIKKKCQIECRKAYKNYVSTMLSDDIKSNPNRLWSFIKSKRCDSTALRHSLKAVVWKRPTSLTAYISFY